MMDRKLLCIVLFQMNSAPPMEGTSGSEGENDSQNLYPSKIYGRHFWNWASFPTKSVPLGHDGGKQNLSGIAH